MSKKKKIVILSGMVLLLAVTAAFNFFLTGNSGTVPEEAAIVNASGYFAQYRTERTSTRSEELTQLDGVIVNAAENSTELANALELKTKLTEMTETELYLETLIKAYGFTDCVVTMGLNSDNVNVIVQTTELTQDDAILIYTVIDEECGSYENVKIIPIT